MNNVPDQNCPNCGHTFPAKTCVTAEDMVKEKDDYFRGLSVLMIDDVKCACGNDGRYQQMTTGRKYWTCGKHGCSK